MIDAAVRSSGRTLSDGPLWSLLPASHQFLINGKTVFWSITETLRQQLLMAADFRAALRFTQTVTEGYSLKVHANQSQLLWGVIENVRNYNISAQDDRDWRLIEQYEPPPASMDNNGDYYEDGTSDPDTGRAGMIKALETVVSVARTDILRSHRNNRISWECPLQPQIQRNHTIEINSQRVKARGKVYQYVHRFDFDRGAAETEIVIAVSQAQTAGAQGDSPVVAPAVPDSRVPVTEGNPTPEIIDLGTWLGGDPDSLVFDEQWRGYSGNYTVEAGASQVYSAQMTLESPAVPDTVRDEHTVDASQDYHVDIPDEYMILEQ